MLSKGPSGHKHPGAPWGLCELSLLHPAHYLGKRGVLTHPIAALGVRAPLTDGCQVTCYSCKVLSAALSSDRMVLLSYTCIEQCNCDGFDDLKPLLKNCASKLPEIPFFQNILAWVSFEPHSVRTSGAQVQAQACKKCHFLANACLRFTVLVGKGEVYFSFKKKKEVMHFVSARMRNWGQLLDVLNSLSTGAIEVPATCQALWLNLRGPETHEMWFLSLAA